MLDDLRDGKLGESASYASSESSELFVKHQGSAGRRFHPKSEELQRKDRNVALVNVEKLARTMKTSIC